MPACTSAALFRECRHALGQSAESMARLLHVRNGRTVRKWEAGENDVPGPAWVALAYLLRDAGAAAIAARVDALLSAEARSTGHG